MANRAQAETVEVNGLELNYQEWGESRSKHALLLLHGFGETSSIWEEIAVELSREFRVLALDQRGHGGSARVRDHNYSRNSQVEDLRGVRRGRRAEQRDDRRAGDGWRQRAAATPPSTPMSSPR